MRPVKETKAISLGLIIKAVDGKLKGDAQKMIRGAAPFETATPDDITFVEHKRILKRINDTQAGAILISTDLGASNQNMIQVDHPKLAFAKVMKLLAPAAEPHWGICTHTDIGRNFVHGQRVAIGPFVAIGDNVRVGNRVVLHGGVVIGNDVEIGNEVEIYPNVTILDDCRIGHRVTIHAGTVIGSDGFGFVPEGDTYAKMPQWGTVQIDDEVEIGAVNTIDRATFGKTWIQKGVKTDNMVHIGHNVTVGKYPPRCPGGHFRECHYRETCHFGGTGRRIPAYRNWRQRHHRTPSRCCQIDTGRGNYFRIPRDSPSVEP